MKQIKILPIHRNMDNISKETWYNALMIDRSKYDIKIDYDDPEYIIVWISHIIYVKNLWNLFKEKYSEDRVIIFYGDEAISPDMNIFDYAIGYDDVLNMNDRVAWRPTIVNRGGNEIRKKNRITYDEAEKEYGKRKFCNFIYSNGRANLNRDRLFYEISNYKNIDSLGRHLNNCENIITRKEANWFQLSIEMKRNYRFSIAAENSKFSGYTSEKIVSSFLSHSIPIYWGNVNIEKEFNKKAFINCNNLSGKDIIELVRDIDENKDKWIDMVTQPWQTKEQEEYMDIKIKEYKEFIDNIFKQDLKNAKRVYSGTAVWNYFNHYIRE